MRHINAVEWFEIESVPPPKGVILLWWRHNPMPGEIADMIFSGFITDEESEEYKEGELVLVGHDSNLDYRSQLSHWAHFPTGPQR